MKINGKRWETTAKINEIHWTSEYIVVFKLRMYYTFFSSFVDFHYFLYNLSFFSIDFHNFSLISIVSIYNFSLPKLEEKIIFHHILRLVTSSNSQNVPIKLINVCIKFVQIKPLIKISYHVTRISNYSQTVVSTLWKSKLELTFLLIHTM